MRLIVFDDGLGALSPLTDLRPSFAVRTGARTTLERIIATLGDPFTWSAVCVQQRHNGLFDVPEGIEQLTPDRIEAFVGDEPVLMVNGRCVLPPAAISSLDEGDTLVAVPSEDNEPVLIAAIADGSSAAMWARGNVPDSPTTTIESRCCLRRPWDVRRFRDDAIAMDVARLADAMGDDKPPREVASRGEHKLSIHDDADVWPGVVFDVSKGPVVVDAHATIRPGAVITGPTYIGEHSTINDNAVIKANTSIGPHCKVGGEVGGTIFQGYANKGHDGHLGDSFIGEWANLGAGTTNSNLLNTYADVVSMATPGGRNERTGLQFLGVTIGDHVKTAINTRIMTGAVVHTGTMYAATSPISGCLAPMRWLTDAGDRPYRFDKFLDVAKTVMGRRGLEPSEAYIDILKSIGTA